MPPSRCVVQNCSNRANGKKGIPVHLSPLDNIKDEKFDLRLLRHMDKTLPQLVVSLYVQYALAKIASKGVT
jgi:hypothetical protein